MDAVYYFMVDVGPVLAPVVLGGCWYAMALGLVSTGAEPDAATGRRRRRPGSRVDRQAGVVQG